MQTPQGRHHGGAGRGSSGPHRRAPHLVQPPPPEHLPGAPGLMVLAIGRALPGGARAPPPALAAGGRAPTGARSPSLTHPAHPPAHPPTSTRTVPRCRDHQGVPSDPRRGVLRERLAERPHHQARPGEDALPLERRAPLRPGDGQRDVLLALAQAQRRDAPGPEAREPAPGAHPPCTRVYTRPRRPGPRTVPARLVACKRGK